MNEGFKLPRQSIVLIVEDDGDLRESISEVLRDSGREVVSAADGSEALHLLEVADVPRPCIVLLDWPMRPRDGEDFLSRLSARADADQFSILIISGDSLVPAISIAPGVLGVLRRPFEVGELFDLLDSHCPSAAARV